MMAKYNASAYKVLNMMYAGSGGDGLKNIIKEREGALGEATKGSRKINSLLLISRGKAGKEEKGSVFLNY